MFMMFTSDIRTLTH